ncbi:MAG: gliding motility-associated C-terminal domain-containing protein, partial [Bacteroidota bacterium]
GATGDSVLLWLTLGLFLTPLSSVSQPFTCDGSAYLAAVSANENATILYRTSTNNPADGKWEAIQSYPDQIISPIGYNVNDNLIYGIDQTNWNLITIDTKGEQVILTSMVEKLDTTMEYHAGTISPRGSRFHIIERDPITGHDKRMLNIRLNDGNYRIGILTLLGEDPVAMGDITYSPLYGTMIGFDELSNTVVDVNYNFGPVTSLNYQSTSRVNKLGGLFFGRGGRLFGYGSGGGGKENTLYEFDPFSGQAENIETAQNGDETDACGCPYEVAMEKVISQPKVLPCGERLISYRTKNVAGANFSNVTITDTLPIELELLEIERLHQIGKLDTVNNNQILSFTMQDFLLGEDSTLLRVRVKENTNGVLKSQAFMRGLPLALDTLLTSDDPSTEAFRDPTHLEVISLSVELPDSTFICDGATARFRVVPNISDTSIQYIWDSGETSQSVSTDVPGIYTVLVNSTCESEEASIKVVAKEEPLFVELSGDVSILQGETAEIKAESNFSTDALAFAWKLSLDLPLDCENCDRINIVPLEDVEVEVLIEDPFGCKASDVLNILVDKTRDLLINNVFTPNADGINDYFFVKSGGIAMVKELHVVNSWGKTVYSETDIPVNSPSQGWDGKISGRVQPEGVYYWQAVIEYPDGSRDKKSGNLTLMR